MTSIGRFPAGFIIVQFPFIELQLLRLKEEDEIRLRTQTTVAIAKINVLMKDWIWGK